MQKCLICCAAVVFVVTGVVDWTEWRGARVWQAPAREALQSGRDRSACSGKHRGHFSPRQREKPFDDDGIELRAASL